MEEQLYKTMYLKMMNACEEAMELLIRAQRECEELYLPRKIFLYKRSKKELHKAVPFSVSLFLLAPLPKGSWLLRSKSLTGSFPNAFYQNRRGEHCTSAILHHEP